MPDKTRHIPREPVSPRLAAALDQLAEGIIVSDETGEIVFFNRAAARIHGIDTVGVRLDDYAQTFRLLTMDGAPYPSEDLPLARAVQKGEIVDNAYWQIARADGKTILALGKARPVLDEDGRQMGAVLTLRDETERETERRALKAAVALKDVLLREIHHRVKNNLQLVSSLLNFQVRRTKDPVAKDTLADLSTRVDVVADIHRALYDAGETDSIEIVSYLARLGESQLGPIALSFGVSFMVQAEGRCIMPIEKATSVALAANELVLNSLQHAFAANTAPSIKLSMKANTRHLTIDYRDNGRGSLAHFNSSSAPNGFGRLLVAGLERQLNALISGTTEGNGFHVRIDIPTKGNLVAET